MDPLSAVAVVIVCIFGSVESLCPLTGERSAHPSDCSKYLICDNGNLVQRDCVIGTVFNPKIKDCDHKMNVPSCQNFDGMCRRNPCGAGLYCVEDASNDMGYVCLRVTNTNACKSNPCPSNQRCVNSMALPTGYTCLTNQQQQYHNHHQQQQQQKQQRQQGQQQDHQRQKQPKMHDDPCYSNPCSRAAICQVSEFDPRGYTCVVQ